MYICPFHSNSVFCTSVGMEMRNTKCKLEFGLKSLEEAPERGGLLLGCQYLLATQAEDQVSRVSSEAGKR